MTTIRRLAAILALDVVGYSRLMEADEAGTLALLKTRRVAVLEPLVARHRGRVVKLVGDGALIEFASAVDAVQCAVELQRDMAAANRDAAADRRIVLRIGVNLGDVIVEGRDIYGNGVNLAARLEALADPGGICLSAKVRDEVAGKLDIAFEDIGEHAMKNIAEPVRVYRVRGEDAGSAPAVSPPSANRPSIAVLPFANMSGEAEHEYFADGMTEDIITELSRFRNLLVIARNSSFVYKNKPVNVGTVARELGVDYVLEGSVRRAGNRIRITAQLVDAASGKHVWAERYDRELADIFAVQDEVTLNIVGTLAVELEDDRLERAQRKRPESLQAYEHWLRGKRFLWTAGEKNFEARRHFERAIEVDPKFSRAHAGLAVTYLMDALDFSMADLRPIYETSFACAHTALALDDANYEAHVAIAWAYLYRRDYDRSKRHIERAIKLNPNDADTLGNACYLLTVIGEPDEAVRCGEIALRLNPRHPDWYLAYYATALFMARRYSEAVAARFQAPDIFIDSTFFGAALFAQIGREEEARRWADKAVARLAARPGAAAAAAERGYVQLMLENNPFRRPEDREHFAEGMRKAGVPG
jgi:TolB-like protein/class 3 adenylate cyclase